MEIYKGIEIIDLGLYLKKEKTLVIGDLQIGYEQCLKDHGFLVPRFQLELIIDKLKEILKKKDIRRIIINGDIKHEFGAINEQEWRDVLKLFDFLKENNREIILIKGNHDQLLFPIARKRKIKISQTFEFPNVTILHGHVIPQKKLNKKVIIISHEHPAITLRDKIKTEKFKCFLKGRWRDKTLIVIPSFNQITEGTDVLKDKLISPFLKQNIQNFEVFVVGNKIYNFGKIKNISKHYT